jgi:hypothetical protein
MYNVWLRFQSSKLHKQKAELRRLQIERAMEQSQKNPKDDALVKEYLSSWVEWGKSFFFFA